MKIYETLGFYRAFVRAGEREVAVHHACSVSESLFNFLNQIETLFSR